MRLKHYGVIVEGEDKPREVMAERLQVTPNGDLIFTTECEDGDNKLILAIRSGLWMVVREVD
jgi:hypothetical protein